MSTTFTMDKLVKASSISARTIRFYISLGLLAGPVGQGRTASYTKDHLDVLKDIQTLKAQGKSLDEIRRILEDRRADFYRRVSTPEGNFDRFRVDGDVAVEVKTGLPAQRRHQIVRALGDFERAVRTDGNEPKKED